jgi:xylulokinase
MAKLLGIDVGTSGCKVLLIDESGRILKQAGREYPLLVPQPLWSEQNPEDWWAGVEACLAEIGEPNPDAIGLTGQMHGAVIRPAILWNDQRTVAECREIDHTVGKESVRRITCNPPLTGFQAPKVLWLRNHEPENFARVKQVLLPKDYIRYRLSGAFKTEVSDASGTGLLDVAARDWSQEMFQKLNLSPSWFPDVHESDEVTAHTNGAGGLSAGIPIVGGGGDQAAAAVGTGAVKPGVLSVSLGTSGVVFTSIPGASFDPGGAAHTFCHANRGWHAMGVMLSCGGALRWLRDTLYSGQEYDVVNAEAASVAPGAEGLIFLPYLTGERCPHNDPLARGGWNGLTLNHGRGHMARAVFEGVTFGLLDGLNLLKGLGATGSQVRVTGGGAKSALWLQLLADAFEMPVVTLETDEGPAFGAALLAGVGTGIWTDVQGACEATVREKAETQQSGESYAKSYARYRALYPAVREWNFFDVKSA